MKIVVAYIPVIHEGYIKFLDKVQPNEIWILDSDLQAEFPELKKDIRALHPEQIKKSLEVLGPAKVRLLDTESVHELQAMPGEIFMPDEEISHELAKKFFDGKAVSFESVFLRWDRQASLAEKQINSDEAITLDEARQKFIHQAADLSQKSGDWWRQVGAVIVKDGQVLSEGFNQHVPAQNRPYENGDPRGNFHKGEHLDKTTAIHAEALAIAKAAESGTSLAGAELFVTTYPCPACAKLVAYSGIKKVYFVDGYAMVDGESILKERGVELVKVAA